MSDAAQSVAFIGLGAMGFPMAGHLQRAGHSVCVYNRSPDKAMRWQNVNGGDRAPTPKAAAANAEVVCLCVGNDDDVRAVVYGDEGVLAGLQAGGILVDHTTTSATLAEELHQACAQRGIAFMDAPVSGGQAGAESGQLTIMCGGDQAVFDRLKPVFACYGQHAERMGDVGQGQRCKMVNQVCIVGILQGLSEGLLLAQQSGLDIEQCVSALQRGAAGSWQLDNRAFTMDAEQFDFGFAIDWMQKDLKIVASEAERLGLSLPLVRQTQDAYARLQARGHGRSDTSALVLDLKHKQTLPR